MATKELSPLAFNPTSAPASPANGWFYYDSAFKRIETYDGTVWQRYVTTADINPTPAGVLTYWR